jgi:predicted P-loop ATPase
MSTRLDFAAVAAAALSAADRLVPDWLPDGRRSGHEWQSRNPTRSDHSIGSFSVNLTTGAWADFATGDKGGDLVSLRAYLTGAKQGDAAREIAELLHMQPSQSPAAPAPKPVADRTPWMPIVPVDEGAPEPPAAHLKRGRPACTWAYRDRAGRLLGYVYRFQTSDGGKEILPVVWARHGETGERAWRWMQWSTPRPLYGLDRLVDGKPVLIVEGEKCADAAHQALAEWFCVISWPGGGKAVDKVDWSALAGRPVVIWPDCDAQRDKEGALLPEAHQPGMVAAERIAVTLIGIGSAVRIVKIPEPGTKPGGWDVADAIAEGWSAGQLRQLLQLQRAPTAAAPTPAARANAPAADWESGLLRRRGEVVACLANVVLILANHEAWRGVVAFDEFAMRTLKRAPVPGGGDPSADGEWTDVDTSRTVIWLTNAYGMTPTSVMVDEAIELCGKNNAFHPVRDWLAGLQWDGVERIDRWLSDYLSVRFDDYSQRVARWFVLAMVARVMRPGVKFDYCLVLEGRQGLRKSSALRVLAGDWFSDTELDLTNKDAMSAIRGKLLHEFSEMGSIARAEATRQKSFLSRQVDEFRPTYGRREIRCPRQLVFAGTTNDWQWNKDLTGGRRFWPVDVAGEIDTDGLAAVRDQLFAEAFAAWKAGERFWPTADEQRELFDPEQLRREAEDAFFDPIHDWIEHLPKEEFTLHECLAESLKLDAGRITRDVMTRAGMLLHKLGCRRLERRNGVSRFVYLVPAWADYAKAQARQQQVRNSDGPMPF